MEELILLRRVLHGRKTCGYLVIDCEHKVIYISKQRALLLAKDYQIYGVALNKRKDGLVSTIESNLNDLKTVQMEQLADGVYLEELNKEQRKFYND